MMIKRKLEILLLPFYFIKFSLDLKELIDFSQGRLNLVITINDIGYHIEFRDNDTNMRILQSTGSIWYFRLFGNPFNKSSRAVKLYRKNKIAEFYNIPFDTRMELKKLTLQYKDTWEN